MSASLIFDITGFPFSAFVQNIWKGMHLTCNAIFELSIELLHGIYKNIQLRYWTHVRVGSEIMPKWTMRIQFRFKAIIPLLLLRPSIRLFNYWIIVIAWYMFVCTKSGILSFNQSNVVYAKNIKKGKLFIFY